MFLDNNRKHFDIGEHEKSVEGKPGEAGCSFRRMKYTGFRMVSIYLFGSYENDI